MDIFKRHAPKLCCMAILLCCATMLLVEDHYSEANRPPKLSVQVAAVRAAFKRKPSPNYSCGEAAIAGLDFRTASELLDRSREAPDSIAQFVAYPRPARPAVIGSAPPAPDVATDTAVLGAVDSLSVSAEPGWNVLRFNLPALKHMNLLRIEIYRSKGTENSTGQAPYAALKFTEDEGAKGGPSNPRTFIDTHIDPRTAYVYQLRAIGRMSVQPDTPVVSTNAAGSQTLCVIHPPKDARRIGDNPRDFASPASNAAPVESASNCEVRFTGIIGSISAEGTPAERRRTDYRATFGIRIWPAQAQEWKAATLQAAPGERLKGTVLLRNPDSKRMEAFDFDTGFELLEVKWGHIRHAIVVEEPMLDATGQPMLDLRTRRPLLAKVEREGDPIPNEIAVLRDTSTGLTTDSPKLLGAAAKPPNSAVPAR